MRQGERDRLVALKKAKKKLITQKEAAVEIGITERQVRRLLRQLKQRGDRAVVHASRGESSNRKIEEETRQKAIEIPTQDVTGDSGPRWHRSTWRRSTLSKLAGRPHGNG